MSNLSEMEIERRRYFDAHRVNLQARQEDTRRKEFNQKQEGIFRDRIKDIEFKQRQVRQMTGKAKIRAKNQLKQMEKEAKDFKESIKSYAPNRELAEESYRNREIRLRVERLEPKRQEQTVYKEKFEKMIDQINRGEKTIGQAMADTKASIQIRGLDGTTRQGFDAYLRQNHPKIAKQYIKEESRERMEQGQKLNDKQRERYTVKRSPNHDKLKDMQKKQTSQDKVMKRQPVKENTISQKKEQDHGMER